MLSMTAFEISLPRSHRPIQQGNRMPASFMVDTLVPWSFDFPVEALVRDGNRTRDRQSFNLML